MTPLVTGAGLPVTVVAHGLGASSAETRPLVGGVAGTKVFPTARGHGGVPAGTVSYDALGRDLEAVADEHAATQALGVSLGAGTLLALLARRPTRFSRVVLVLPAALDRPRTDDARIRALEAALRAVDADAVRDLVARELPEDLHGLPGLAQHLSARARYLLESEGLADVVGALATDVPVADRAALAAVTADVLVLAQEGDPVHPASVARELAQALPRARLEVFARPGALVRERLRVRELVGAFLEG